MQQHIWSIISIFQTNHQGALVSFDFSNAFPTLAHKFIEAVLTHIQMPCMLIKFIMSTLTAPYMFCVGQGVVPEVLFFLERALAKATPSLLCSSHSVFLSYCIVFPTSKVSICRQPLCRPHWPETPQPTGESSDGHGGIQGCIRFTAKHR